MGEKIIVTTTNDIQDMKIKEYLDILNCNVVLGTNFFSDIKASFSDLFGGYSESYQGKLEIIYKDVIVKLKDQAYQIGADAVIGVKIDFDEIAGGGKSMFMVTAVGTAVTLKR